MVTRTHARTHHTHAPHSCHTHEHLRYAGRPHHQTWPLAETRSVTPHPGGTETRAVTPHPGGERLIEFLRKQFPRPTSAWSRICDWLLDRGSD